MARASYQHLNGSIRVGENTRTHALNPSEIQDIKKAIGSLNRALDAKRNSVAEVNISEAFRLTRDILRSRLNG